MLFPYAYNILGSVDDAKDVVQEVLSNYLSGNNQSPESEKNYLIKSVINRAINAKKRREKTVSTPSIWLPEPVATEDAADLNVYLKDILSYSLLVLLEKLEARERAVFILKESFDYNHQEIGQVLHITEENSRKLLSRARSKLFKPQPSARKILDANTSNLLEHYIESIRSRDLESLEKLMNEDIAFYADGGNKINVVQEICVGVDDVSALLIMVHQKFLSDKPFIITEVNYQPALLFYDSHIIDTCFVFDFSLDGKITQICSVVDPEKLKNIAISHK
jgi:RNA polymerase sigma factor (sigma-70 family)